MRNILVAGGAGFLGSHMCTALVARGDVVTCIDNLSTGRRANIAGLMTDPPVPTRNSDTAGRHTAVKSGKSERPSRCFTFVEADITNPLPQSILDTTYDAVVNMASPASPPHYVRLAVETLMVGSVGTKALLDLAKRDGARYVHASTSEVYGDPQIHPQPETYWGNVNSYGARAMYDESKRFGEALIWVYREQYEVNSGIIRIFNTYGPHMDPQDGRVISNFITQALTGKPITLYGDGRQTRSFCYVSDQIAGFLAMIDSSVEGPVNIGNPHEFAIAELAGIVLRLTGSTSKIVHKPLPPDDPTQRRPDITRAGKLLGWRPTVELEEGLTKTIAYFANGGTS